MGYITYNFKIPSKKKPLQSDFGECVDHVGRMAVCKMTIEFNMDKNIRHQVSTFIETCT
jgi:hypothetical protein